MSDLATLQDVRRVLRIADTAVDHDRDEQLQGALDAQETWFLQRTRGRFVAQANLAIAKYTEITNDAIIHLPYPGATVVALRVGSPFYLRTLFPQEFFALDNERIRLRSGFYWPYGQYDDLYSHATETVEIVELDYIPPSKDPPVAYGGHGGGGSFTLTTEDPDPVFLPGYVGDTITIAGNFSSVLSRKIAAYVSPRSVTLDVAMPAPVSQGSVRLSWVIGDLLAEVPPSISDGISYLAAAAWLSATPLLTTILQEEKIGDYTYRIDVWGNAQARKLVAEQLKEQGMKLLRPWFKPRVSVT